MDAYEFYRFDKLKGCHLIAILPERRRNPERITKESVKEWVRQLSDDHEDLTNIFFVKIELTGFEKEKGTEGPDSVLAKCGKHEKDFVHR